MCAVFGVCRLLIVGCCCAMCVGSCLLRVLFRLSLCVVRGV